LANTDKNVPLLYIIKCTRVRVCKQTRKRYILSKNNPQKVFSVAEFVVPLHPLNREAPCEADEEAIFESIT